MRVFLTGFMGCGKSRRGRELSAALDWPIIDLDTVIAENAGCTITEYFERHGEEEFRLLERKILQEFSYPENCIVAVGGGAACFFDNMEWMNSHGRTVYLKMEPAALVSRLRNREKRPLIKGMDDEQLNVFIKAKLQEREPFYNQARIIVDGLNLTGERLKEVLFFEE